jgi:hypothetical protein
LVLKQGYQQSRIKHYLIVTNQSAQTILGKCADRQLEHGIYNDTIFPTLFFFPTSIDDEKVANVRCDTVFRIEECAYRLHGDFAFLKFEVLEEDRRHDVSALAIGQTYGCLGGPLAYEGEDAGLYFHREAGQAGWGNRISHHGYS